jgi:hypothetical protein
VTKLAVPTRPRAARRLPLNACARPRSKARTRSYDNPGTAKNFFDYFAGIFSNWGKMPCAPEHKSAHDPA